MEQVHFRKLQLEFGFEKKIITIVKIHEIQKKTLNFAEF